MFSTVAKFRWVQGTIARVILLGVLCQPVFASNTAVEEAAPPLPHAEQPIEAPSSNTPPQPEARPLDFKEVYDRTLAATVWIINRGENGQIHTGTGWVVDVERRLIVTNEHVIELTDDVLVFFPEYIDGKLQSEKDYYLRKLRPIEGSAIDSDTIKDLALIQVETMPDGVKALTLAADSPEVADHIHSVGAAPEGSEGLWIYSHGRVRSVVNRTIANGHQAMTVESDMPTNRGNSGGAVVNDFGEVVAVVEGHMNNARLVSLYIDVTEVRTFLNEALPLVDAETPAELVKRGNRHLSERRHYWAISDFTDALLQDPNKPEAISGRGWGLYYVGDYETALADFNDALNRDPNHVEAYQGRGLVHRELGNSDAAIQDFTQAIRLDPLYYDSYNERGVTYYRVGEFAKAESDFSRAIKWNIEDAQLYANRGDALQQMGRNEEAIEDFLKAIELDPENDEFYNYLGLSLYRLGKYENAAEVFAMASQLNPENPTYLSNVCDSLQMLGRYQDSLGFITRAIQLNSRNGYYFASRAWSYQQLKSYPAALADYNEAIRLQSSVAWYYFRRAEVQLAMGNQQLARDDYRKAAQLDPERYSTMDEQVNTASHTTSSNVAGRWRYRGTLNGVRVDVRAHLSDAGTFAYIWRTYLGDGRYSDTTERGTYAVDGDHIVFTSEDGNYLYPYAVANDRLTLRFTEEALTLSFYREG